MSRLSIFTGVAVLCSASATGAQEIVAIHSSDDTFEDATERGVAFTLHGLSGVLVPRSVSTKLAPGARAPDPIAGLTPELDGEGAYIGSGLRVFFQGEHLRIGGAVGALFVDHGISHFSGTPYGYLMRADHAFAGHFEVFAGGQLDLRPIFPYADLLGVLDVVQTRYHLSREGEGLIDAPAFNAYAFGVGPRLGVIVPISRHLYLDLAAAGSVIGMNRFMFTAGFGYTTGARPVHRRME